MWKILQGEKNQKIEKNFIKNYMNIIRITGLLLGAGYRKTEFCLIYYNRFYF